MSLENSLLTIRLFWLDCHGLSNFCSDLENNLLSLYLLVASCSGKWIHSHSSDGLIQARLVTLNHFNLNFQQFLVDFQFSFKMKTHFTWKLLITKKKSDTVMTTKVT